VLRLELEPALLLLRLQIWEGAQSDAVAGRVLGTIRTWLDGEPDFTLTSDCDQRGVHAGEQS